MHPFNALRRSRLAPLVAALIFVALPASADDMSDADAKRFFNAKGCNACHGVDELRIGPSYRMVALRYEATPASVDRLAMKIIFGGSGAWGPVPMVSNPSIGPEEAQGLARWILKQGR